MAGDRLNICRWEVQPAAIPAVQKIHLKWTLAEEIQIMNVRSKEELIAWSRRFVEIAGDGESEIHELFEPPS